MPRTIIYFLSSSIFAAICASLTIIFLFDFHISTESNNFLENFIFYKIDFNEDRYYNHLSIITSFYNTIIAFLLVLITLVSALAFIVVRASAREAAESAASVHVPLFLQTQDGKDILASVSVKEHIARFEKIEDAIRTMITEIEEGSVDFTSVTYILNGDLAGEKTD